jgi:glyoxylate reductase
MKRVFITRKLPAVARDTLAQHFEVVQHDGDGPVPRERLPALVREFHGILSTVADRFDRAILDHASTLTCLSNYAVGLDNIDVAYARERGVHVYNLPPNVTIASTADLTMGVLLALVRRIPEGAQLVREGKWTSWDPNLCLGQDLPGKTLGIIGMGAIGKAVARRALGFDMRVVFHNRSVVTLEGPLKDHVQQVSFEELLGTSDFISIHVPLTPDTKGLINDAAFAAMRRRPVLVNMARGAVIDTAALLRAFAGNQIRGAALDVTDPEPLPGDHPLLALPNCLVVPHVGTSTIECRHDMAKHAAERMVRHFQEPKASREPPAT